mgnify:CR=1 FL=1|tara:strand:- start:5827 stop:6432 length:606 start_codon:yes stop_codon:yes gene_type:complete
MSQIKLLHSGGNGVILAAPSSNPASDRTLTLPGDADGTILTSNSSTGKILQTIMVNKTDATSTSGSTRADISGLTVNITPSATSSKILVMSTLNFCGRPGEYAFAMYLMRGSTDIAIGDTAGSRKRATIGGLTDGSNGYDMRPWHVSHLDSPNTTSQVTYKWQWHDPYHSQTIYLNRSYNDADGAYASRGASNIIVQEVAA